MLAWVLGSSRNTLGSIVPIARRITFNQTQHVALSILAPNSPPLLSSTAHGTRTHTPWLTHTHNTYRLNRLLTEKNQNQSLARAATALARSDFSKRCAAVRCMQVCASVFVIHKRSHGTTIMRWITLETRLRRLNIAAHGAKSPSKTADWKRIASGFSSGKSRG